MLTPTYRLTAPPLAAAPRRGWFGAVAVLVLIAALFAAACGGTNASTDPPSGALLLATTTSTNDSGLLEDLVPIFERRTGINVKVIAVGTGAALRMAEEGNADVLLVHAPDAERALVASGDLINRRIVAYNDFILAGPADDPAGVRDAPDATIAFARIAAAEARFVSRGDDSGTHKKERALWDRAGIEPSGGWYQETGQGMGASLTIAGQRRAYILTDRATFLALSRILELIVLVEGDPLLINIYSVIQVNPDKGRINGAASAAWVAFLLEPETQDRIGLFRAEEFGRPLFTPARGRSEAQVIDDFGAQ